jgi:hypothetical protein
LLLINLEILFPAPDQSKNKRMIRMKKKQKKKKKKNTKNLD